MTDKTKTASPNAPVSPGDPAPPHEVTKELAGVPPWLLQRYLNEAAAQWNPEEVQWQAEVQPIEGIHHPGMTIERVELRITGERSVVEAVLAFLLPRVMRGGA